MKFWFGRFPLEYKFARSIALAGAVVVLLPASLDAKGRAQATRSGQMRPAEESIFKDDSSESSASDAEPTGNNVVPDIVTQQASMRDVKEVYGEAWKNANTPDQEKGIGSDPATKGDRDG